MTTTTTATHHDRIVSLQVENYKRLRLVRLTPCEGVTEIAGRNGQGKSSLLDAVAAALGGAREAAEKPIRKGAKDASIVLKTERLVVTRKFTASGSTLLVTGADGTKFSKAQEVCDALFGDLSFDPLAFTRMKPADQVAVLKRVTGLTDSFDKLDADRKAIELERTECGRERTRQQGALGTMPNVEAPAAQVSVAELVGHMNTLRERAVAIQEARREFAAAVKERSDLEASIASLQARLAGVTKWITDNTADVEALVDPDLAGLQQQIATAEDTNRRYEQGRRRAETVKAVAELDEHYDGLTRKLEAIDERKVAALQAAKLPVEGLSFGDDGLQYNGQPLSQASGAEKIRVSVAIGLAQNPTLRLMLVHDGSLLDRDGMAELARIATAANAQVWVERVGDSVGGCGVVIEDGSISDDTAQN